MGYKAAIIALNGLLVTQMAKTPARTHSRYNRAALQLLAGMIRSERLKQRLTTQEVAGRAGISRSMLQRVEKTDPACAIGSVFEVATVLSVPLFEQDVQALDKALAATQQTLALLPKSAHKPRKEVDDDF
ncbi:MULTISPECIES: helix-turn-helix transcriptional regulator [unclassified Marinobacter]|uniref:helix-turn-helix domain-containing protein n=1 Tax=unclassified Marinobacter TaxID=83889 RepID=UPI00200FC109|nr:MULTISPECIES: helix-turn-helix transcriptional regulator [unclassified Marinobacter]MCL1479730.1 helix-turn-helix domain-containing protein [Marinobacter sp.]UQG58236.1 helix-turn-helix domain-containing protein [Marinobacter sp. M4C]UQG67042.1 helix-turn-helix domain-containing protein [Marinobacter sp. M2C]UQG71321.1 helix-turn-helix domain-containing protein [Marinobacter sp. M1C]